MSQACTLLLERQCRKSSCTNDDFMALLMSVVDEKAVFRTRYNRIPHSTKDVKREKNTDIKDGFKYNTKQAESLF